jgi:hypothetical protein
MLTYIYDASGALVTRSAATVVAPEIIAQPSAQTAKEDEIVTFSVVVTCAAEVTFQWSFNGTDIEGATGDSYVVRNLSNMDEGLYAVTAFNPGGTVISASAQLLLDRDDDELPDAWEVTEFGNVTSQRGAADPDHDSISNLDEFRDGTDPTDPASLRPRLVVHSDDGGTVAAAPTRLSYELGAIVTLTAIPFPPHVFVGWGGDASGITSPTTVTMDRSRAVRGRFASAIPPPPGLVALWRGESDATDSIAAHHGTFMAGAVPIAPRLDPAGKVGGALSFDGSVHVQIPDADGRLQIAQFTVEGWIFPTMFKADHQTVVARGSSTGVTDTWWLGLFDGTPRFWSHGAVLLPGRSAIGVGRWTHLAATFDGTTKRLYVNGTEVARQVPLGVLEYDPAAPVTVGADWTAGAPSDHFSGLIDELALYVRALTTEEVRAIYRADRLGKDLTRPYFTSSPRFPDAVLDQPYMYPLAVIFGTGAIRFDVTAGVLPPGVALSPAGLLGGTPTADGFFGCTVSASDTAGASTMQSCVLRVLAAAPAPVK